ncbi:MAG: cytochrome c-type biogenesis protein CcmE [Chloroflexi bacterium]|jgi:cytochrome c-type biogenesis protein CcmE|nr:MAG: cytochrome c-type biogenesis protein CcmE [Chloroflexota bacterium]
MGKTSNRETVSATREPEGFFSGARKVYVAVSLLAIAVGFLAVNAFQGATVYYLTVEELLAEGNTNTDTIRVSGKLIPASFERETQGTLAHFELIGNESVLKASYDGILPELFFNEHSDIVLEGSMSADGHFHSETIIVKCPTKYEASPKTPEINS